MTKFEDEIKLHYNVLDVVYHMEYYSYESGERWVIIDIDVHTEKDYLCKLIGISNSNMGQECTEFSYDLRDHEVQLNDKEKKLFKLLYL